MSTYEHKKVLRVPLDKYKHNFLPDADNAEDIEFHHDDFWCWMEEHYK